MTRRRAGAIGVSLALIVVGLSACGSDDERSGPPLPRRIVAIGDSISRATNACCLPGDQPGRSWSVGDVSGDAVRSHLERVASAQPDTTVRALNVARAGATVADTVGQARLAVRWRPDYVTIMIGANDACGSPVTSVEAFRDRLRDAIAVLERGAPSARLFVASIPNVVRLWLLFRDDPVARGVWRAAATCPSVLSAATTEAERSSVLERVRRFNAVLRRTCAEHPRCRSDGGAVFRYAFQPEEVSALDRFHPSIEGQAALARITWARTWWS